MDHGFRPGGARRTGDTVLIDPQVFNRNKIDRVVVMGIMASASPDEGQVMLEQLIENHHYSTKGFSFLPQMSATNNTETSGSVYQKNLDYLPKGYYDGSVIQDIKNTPHAEAHNFAQSLGIREDLFEEVNHAAMVEAYEGAAMNKALYPSTIGNFIEVLADPVVNKTAYPKIRSFFNAFVTAGGPVPAIRIGDQPYGTVITSDLRQWKEHDAFFTGLTATLLGLQLKWDAITAAKVSFAGKGGDPSEQMLNLLGLNAGSVSFNQRLGNLPDFSLTFPSLQNILGSFVSKQAEIVKLLEDLGFQRGNMGFPDISNLTFYDFVNSIAAKNLVDRKDPSETRFLDKLAGTDKNYIEWLISVKKIADLEHQRMGEAPPRTILYLLLRYAILQELKRASEIFYNNANVPYKRVAFEKSLYNFNATLNDISEWEILNGVPKKVDAAKFNVEIPIGDHFLTLRDNSETSRNLAEMREAMQVLAQLPTARLHKYLSDHIDLVSYRLDAWQTGLFYRRLLAQRTTAPNGIYIGAFGWVENLVMKPQDQATVPTALRPADRSPVNRLQSNAGFVHTPSLNHATAAGVLLAGYQNHATKSNPGPFAVNLSSERVRRATFVLEGIQNNQPLEALLGYQFERALHDITSENPANNLNQYILAFREKFPIEHASIPQQGNEAQETVSPFSVVNGLKIVQAKTADIKVVVTNQAHAQLVLKEQDRLEDTLDALNDLLVSEAAFQATQGKMDRTAGLLNALQNAEVPPQLEVDTTPRSTHLAITNRVTLHFDHGASQQAGTGWPNTPSPKSAVEPGLNQWLGQIIGRPDRILCGVSHTDAAGTASAETQIALSELKLQPIDLVYMGGEDIKSGAQELQSRLIRVYLEKKSVPAGSNIRVSFDPTVQAASKRGAAVVLPLLRDLRWLITTARPANAKDFESKSKTQTKNADILFGWQVSDLNTRVKSALAKLKALRTALLTTAPNGKHPKEQEESIQFQKAL